LYKHSLYGVAAPELGWVPAPRYILRRARVLRHLKQGRSLRALDVGCGAGALLVDLSERHFRCVGLEAAPEAAAVAKAVSAKAYVEILSEPDPNWSQTFDVISAFEVLEHIRDDKTALASWIKWLKPNGLFIASVPCHMDRWSVLDDWAGHVRRYERQELEALFTGAGLEIMAFEGYGFPLVNLISGRRTKHYQAEMDKRATEKNLDQSTAASGIDRSGLVQVFDKLCSPLGLAAMWVAIHLQNLFLRTDWGDGYLVVGRLREGR
jgi:2-polyprenyl-3-methyl-5-hydroxy-6-metoxy-1,4-benzoquinol methylase